LSYPEKHSSSAPLSPTEIQVVDSCTGRTVANLSNKMLEDATLYEHISLEGFMKITHIPTYKELTQAHMIINGIFHWSFFKTATKMGFPLGTAFLLCNTATKIQPYLQESTGSPFGPPPQGSQHSSLPMGVGTYCDEIESFLCMCHIPSKDQVTCAHIKVHGITQWSFFIKSSKDKLLNLGFPLGTSQLVCEGVAKVLRKQKKDQKE
jgi:hypothetical protein